MALQLSATVLIVASLLINFEGASGYRCLWEILADVWSSYLEGSRKDMPLKLQMVDGARDVKPQLNTDGIFQRNMPPERSKSLQDFRCSLTKQLLIQRYGTLEKKFQKIQQLLEDAKIRSNSCGHSNSRNITQRWSTTRRFHYDAHLRSLFAFFPIAITIISSLRRPEILGRIQRLMCRKVAIVLQGADNLVMNFEKQMDRFQKFLENTRESLNKNKENPNEMQRENEPTAHFTENINQNAFTEAMALQRSATVLMVVLLLTNFEVVSGNECLKNIPAELLSSFLENARKVLPLKSQMADGAREEKPQPNTFGSFPRNMPSKHLKYLQDFQCCMNKQLLVQRYRTVEEKFEKIQQLLEDAKIDWNSRGHSNSRNITQRWSTTRLFRYDAHLRSLFAFFPIAITIISSLRRPEIFRSIQRTMYRKVAIVLQGADNLLMSFEKQLDRFQKFLENTRESLNKNEEKPNEVQQEKESAAHVTENEENPNEMRRENESAAYFTEMTALREDLDFETLIERIRALREELAGL